MYSVDLGDDALGNIVRINNALDKLPERLEEAKSQLATLNRQVEAAKLELSNPFEQEQELQEKESRLAILNAELNIDGDGGLDVLNDKEQRDIDYYDDEAEEDLSDLDDYQVPQPAVAKAKPSIIDSIMNYDRRVLNNNNNSKVNEVEM